MRTLLTILVLLLTAAPAIGRAHTGPEQVAAELSQQIQERPNDMGLYIQRGSAYTDAGQFELALADFKKAESLGDPVAVAYHQGILHHRIGKLAAARDYLDRFLARFPDHAPSLELRGQVLRDAGEHEAAVADFNAYLAREKAPNPGNYVSAAKAVRKIEGEGIAAALAMLDRGIDRLGLIPQLQQFAIELELERNDLPRAIDRQRSLEPTLGGSPDWKVEMGALLLRAGRSEEAQALFEAAALQLATLRSTAARRRVHAKLEVLYPQGQKSD